MEKNHSNCMEKTNSKSTKTIVLTALLSALTVAGSSLRITIPVDIAGTTSFHLGNIMCALSGILLGPWYGAAAAGIGSAIYDMLNPLYISEAWITFLTKGCYGLASGLVISLGKRPWGYWKATMATVAGALTYAALYLGKTYFYSGMLLKGLSAEAAALTVVTKLPATTFNAVIAVICAPVLAVAIRKALEQNRLTLN